MSQLLNVAINVIALILPIMSHTELMFFGDQLVQFKRSVRGARDRMCYKYFTTGFFLQVTNFPTHAP